MILAYVSCIINKVSWALRYWLVLGWDRPRLLARGYVPFSPTEHILSYLEAILRIYNFKERRENKHKAWLKILVKAMDVDAFASLVIHSGTRIAFVRC